MTKFLLLLTVINIGVALYITLHPNEVCPPALIVHTYPR